MFHLASIFLIVFIQCHKCVRKADKRSKVVKVVDIFSPPPKSLGNPSWLDLKKDAVLYRIVNKKNNYFKNSLDFRTEGPLCRFDHHVSQSLKRRGVIYTATTLDCCLFECFSDTGTTARACA
jgi:hypothetical protein